MILKIKNYCLESIEKVLNYPNPNFQIGRSKMRILKLLDEKKRINEASRMEMLNALSEKDEKGKPVMKDGVDPKTGQKQKKFDLTPENSVKFNEEFVKMMGEDCLIDIPDSMTADLGTFKMLINNSPVNTLADADIAILEEVLASLDEASPKPAEKNPVVSPIQRSKKNDGPAK